MTAHDAAIEGRIMGMLREDLHVDVESSDTDLLGTGLLDSLGLVELIVMLERDFQVRVDMADLDPDHFQTVARIGALVRRMMNHSGSAE